MSENKKKKKKFGGFWGFEKKNKLGIESKPMFATKLPQSGEASLTSGHRNEDSASISEGGTTELWERAWRRLAEEEPVSTGAFFAILSSGVSSPASVAELRGLAMAPGMLSTYVKQRLTQMQEKQWKLKFADSSITIREQMDRVIGAMNSVKDIAISAAFTDPIHAGLPVAGLCLILQFLSADKDQRDEMMTGLEVISHIIRRYAAIEHVYLSEAIGETSRMLSLEMEKLYTLVLRYETRVVIHLNRTTKSQTFQHMTGNTSWNEERIQIRAADDICTQLLPIMDLAHHSLRSAQLKEILVKQNENIRAALVASYDANLDEEALKALRNFRMTFERWRDGEEARSCKETLRTSAYEHIKDRNPRRAANTCKWFIQHAEFQRWLDEQASACLWVTADPGCGKSVLSRYLVDEYMDSLRQSGSNVCYFFFKDGDYSARAEHFVSAILHQLICQNGKLLRHARKAYEDNGNKLGSLFESLWGVFLDCIQDPEADRIVCVLDALDECTEDLRTHLVAKLSSLYSTPNTSKKIKFIITSRPNTFFQDAFLFESDDRLGIIRLTGEGEREMNAIAKEINIFTEERIKEFQRRRQHVCKIQDNAADILRRRMADIENRTYLWISLIFPELIASADLAMSSLLKVIETIPQTVEAAYQRILDRSTNLESARKLLHIVVAWQGTLTLTDLKVAFNIGSQHQSRHALEEDLISDDAFRSTVRERCGLFIRFTWKYHQPSLPGDHITSGRYLSTLAPDRWEEVSLIHHTAREFLVSSETSLIVHDAADQTNWKHSLTPCKSNHVLAEVCMLAMKLYLQPTDRLLAHSSLASAAISALFQYSHNQWFQHFNKAGTTDQFFVECALEICDGIMQTQAGNRYLATIKSTGLRSLFAAVSMQLKAVVPHILKTRRPPLDQWHPDTGETPLSRAVRVGNPDVVRLFCDINGIDVNLREKSGALPFLLAVESGNFSLVHIFLTARKPTSSVDATTRDSDGYTALMIASEENYVKIIEELLDLELRQPDSVNINAQDYGGRTALWHASSKGSEAIVKLLTEIDAIDVNLSDNYQQTPLHAAVSCHQNNHDDSPKENFLDTSGKVRNHHCRKTVQWLLLSKRIDINLVDGLGRTALFLAVQQGHNEMIRQLLHSEGIDVNKADDRQLTPLLVAVETCSFNIAYELLSAKGIDVNVGDEYDFTPLMRAALLTKPGWVRILLEVDEIDTRSADLRHLVHYLFKDHQQQMEADGTDIDGIDVEGIDLEGKDIGRMYDTLGKKLVIDALGPRVEQLSPTMLEVHNVWVRNCRKAGKL